MKKFNTFLPIYLCLSIFLGNFGLPTALAYENTNVKFRQVKTATALNNSGTTLNKINSISSSVNGRSQGSSMIQNGKIGTQKTQQTDINKKDYEEGEILVKYKNSKVNLQTISGRATASNFISSKSLERKEDLRKSNISVLKIKDAKTVEQKLSELKADPNVEYAEPNYLRYPAVINTDDTYKDRLWGLDSTGQLVNGVSGTNDADIDAPEAWAISDATTSSQVIVAIIDSGVAYNHPDLLGNMWNGADCKDENGNPLGGCNHGYDYEDNDKTPLPTTSSHGTDIAGIISAIKNNAKGVIGVAPQAKIMAIKYGFNVSDEIKAIDFAIQNGAKIINASFTGASFSQLEFDAINRFKTAGGIFVAAAGNQSANNENTHLYPSDYNLDNIISVAATHQDDGLASFSNYGATSVDVGAPGTNIYSTTDATNLLDETFQGVTVPNTPSGWVKDGTNNKWATYDFNNDSWGKMLYGQVSSFPYDSNADTTITSPAYNLGGSMSGATVDFWAGCDTEYITNGWADYMQVEYSADGVNFSTTTDPYYKESPDGFRWDEPTFDYLNGEDPLDSTGSSVFHYANIPIPSQYLTSNFKLRFRWVTNSSDNNYGGCLVDDVKITKYSDGSDEKYIYSDGTSMATPYVAGLAALIEGYNPNLTFSQVKNTILTTGDSLPALSGKTVSGKRINAQKAIQAVNPAKAITTFSIPGQVGSTTISETDHTIAVTVPFETNVTALVPTIVITGASVSPLSGVAHDFTASSTYIVTAVDSSTQAYVVTVSTTTNPDIAIVVADKAALVDDSIKGGNIDLSNITVALTNPLLSTGANGSTITWISDAPTVVSNDGQTIDRPAFESGDVAVTLTATITKGIVSDTKSFSLTVLKLPVSTVATTTSATYTVSSGGTATETITNIPFGTAKATFLAALDKGETHQTWIDTGISDPVVTGNTLVVTAQDGTTVVTYTVTVAVAAPSDLTVLPDTTAPVITLIGSNPMNLTVGGIFTDPGATAIDNKDGSVTVVVTGSVNVATVGVYTVTYTATDIANNTATTTRTVNVNAAPVAVTPPPGGGGGGGGGGSTPVIVIPTITKKGDANKDSKVDKYDFSLMMANWGKIGTNNSDFNNDGKVDKYDFALLMSNWGL